MTERVYFHRAWPPVDARPVGEGFVEARTTPVRSSHDERTAHWAAAQTELDALSRSRIEQELDRLGADFAHVFEEHVEDHVDPGADTFQLRGRYRFVTYRAT
jgi:hypothetical protein